MTTPIVTERGRLTALRAAALFDGTRSALVRDPLIVIDGDTITTPGGHCHYLGGVAEPTVAGVRAAVREHAERGADVIKIMASGGNQPRVTCRSSDYRFMIALVGVGVGVALVPSLALTGRPQVRDLQITPQPTRYIGAYLPQRHQPNPAAERLLAALRAHSGAIHQE